MTTKVPILIRLEPAEHAKLQALAAETGYSIAELIRASIKLAEPQLTKIVKAEVSDVAR